MKSLFNLIGYYNLFLKKKILGKGLISNKLFRGYIALIGLLVYSSFLFIVYTFMKNANYNTKDFLAEAYTLSIFTWTFMLFIVLKYIFNNASDFIKITDYFPFTNAQRKHSFAIYEFIVLYGLILLASSVYGLSLILLDFNNWDYLLYGVILTAFYAATIITLIYTILNFLIQKIKNINKFTNLVSLIIIILLMSIYLSKQIDLISKYVDKYFMNSSGTIDPFIVWLYLGNTLGLFKTLLIFTIYSLVVWYIILKIVLKSNNTERVIITKIINFKQISIFKTYILAYIRDIIFIENLILWAVVVMIMITYNTIETNNLKADIAFTVYLFPFLGFYMFEKTQRVRQICYNHKYSAVTDYLNLIGAQTIINFIAFCILSIVSMQINFEILTNLMVGIAYFTTLGILFPPHNKNPFAPLISLIISLILLIFILILYLLFIPNLNNEVISNISELVVIVIISLIGISTLMKTKKEEYNEKKITN